MSRPRVRVLNRLERVGERMRAALNDLASLAPEWLKPWPLQNGTAPWPTLRELPSAQDRCRPRGVGPGHRGRWGAAPAAVDAASDYPLLAQVPAVLTLRRVWAEQYTGTPGQLRWREVKDMPSPAGSISPPDDTDARYSTKCETESVGRGPPDRDVRRGDAAPDRGVRQSLDQLCGRPHNCSNGCRTP